VGPVGPVSASDRRRMQLDDPLLQLPGFQIGKTGVEQKHEHRLRGRAGTRQIEVNAAGRVMRELDRDDGVPGSDLQLTVESRLQNFVEARLTLGLSASAVVIDVTNGDLAAVGNAPSFDPNKFVRGISVADYADLTGNIYRPLANKAVQGAYPPGSTFKMMGALAALEAGVVSPNETVYCGGYTSFGNRRFHCWKRGGHGRVDLERSLQQSCDVYYYEMAQRLGIDRIAATARRFGMGERFELPMSAVTAGAMPDTTWIQETYGQRWRAGDSLNASIGQGYVLSSPLQLAVMTARLASGRRIVPRLVRSIDGVEVPAEGGEALDIDPRHLELMREGMFAVSNVPGGTAYRSRIENAALRMAGKTGTSQVRSTIVDNAQVPWEERDHALFVGFAPHDAPRYAVSVVVEHGGGGSAAAAPVARDIMLFALHGQLPPLDDFPAGERDRVEETFAALDLREDFRPTRIGRSRA